MTRGVRRSGGSSVSNLASGVECFVQWKATDIFAELVCECGADGYVNGFCCYHARCRECGRVYRMPSLLKLEPLTGEAADEALKGACHDFGPLPGEEES